MPQSSRWWGEVSDSWGYEVQAAIDKGLPDLDNGTKQSFNVGVPMQPDETTRTNITDTYARRGYKVEWTRVPDFGYNVVISKLSSGSTTSRVIGLW